MILPSFGVEIGVDSSSISFDLRFVSIIMGFCAIIYFAKSIRSRESISNKLPLSMFALIY
jgi:hypothetical protein